MLLKIMTVALLVVGFSGSSFAQSTYVKGYTKKDGTYVAPHHRSAPDGNKNNNWSTQGNTNPYTGKSGTQAPTYGGSSTTDKDKDE